MTKLRAKKKRRNRDELRQDIITAATELFAREGYSAPSIREIAAHADVALPALYRFFVNKHDLYVQCCRQALQNDLQLLNGMGAMEALKNASPELIIYSTTLALFARRTSNNAPDIVSRAIFDGDAHMIHDEAKALFGSEYYQHTLKAAAQLSDQKNAVRRLALVHSLTFAFQPILSFWQPFTEVNPAADSNEAMALEVLQTIFPSGNWEEAAKAMPSLTDHRAQSAQG